MSNMTTEDESWAKAQADGVALVRTGLILSVLPFLCFVYVLMRATFSSALTIGILTVALPIFLLAVGYSFLYKAQKNSKRKMRIFRSNKQEVRPTEISQPVPVPTAESALTPEENRIWMEITKGMK